MEPLANLTIGEITPCAGEPAYEEMLALRRRVLRQPLGLDFSAADLEAEADQIHLAASRDGRIVGSLLLVAPDTDGVAKLRQMAIEPAQQRRGFGARLVEAGQAELQRRAASAIELAARLPAIPFYKKLGYVIDGQPYIALTITHVRMIKHLRPNADTKV